MLTRARPRVALTALLLLGLAATSCGPSRISPGPSAGGAVPSPARPTPTPVDTGTVRRSVEAFLPEAERFVESHRHLRYTRPVAVTALDDEPFRRRLEQLPGDSPEDLEKTTKELRSLGLIEGQVDLGKLERELLGDAVEGFYDPQTRDLVVRGRSLTPWVREVIVHELTHALQDQSFNINRPEVDKAPDEQGVGWHTLLEGDALRIEDAYHQAMSRSDQTEADEEGTGGIPPADVPRVMIEQLGFPYEVGPPFVDALVRSRGEAGLNAAFRAPPTTSSQVMHPERYLSRTGPVHVDPPPADGKVFDQGAVGEETLLIVLEQAVQAGHLSESQAADAAATWAGDWSTAWDAGGRSCLRVQIVTLGSAAPLRAALRAYAATRSGTTVAGNGPLTLTSCG